MPRRLSQYSQARIHGKKYGGKFKPPLNEWVDACNTYAYDKQIAKHFDVCVETFYSFIDRERVIVESGEKSAYLEALKNGRNESRKEALQMLRDLAKKGDAAGIIFSAKTFGGLLEEKDIRGLQIRRYEAQLKASKFMTELAETFNLNKQELENFSKKYFADNKVDI